MAKTVKQIKINAENKSAVITFQDSETNKRESVCISIGSVPDCTKAKDYFESEERAEIYEKSVDIISRLFTSELNDDEESTFKEFIDEVLKPETQDSENKEDSQAGETEESDDKEKEAKDFFNEEE